VRSGRIQGSLGVGRLQYFNQIGTSLRRWSLITFALALSGSAWTQSVLADEGVNATSAGATTATLSDPVKQWVWLPKQNCWGYGYQRPDGYWQIDPGSKRPAAASGEDPYGFVSWLNTTRSSFGLSAVGYDQNLTNWAAMNNTQQQARGIGHHVMGPARRQNAAIGSAASIGAQWMASPAHRAALLDPNIRMIGIAGLGAYWTFNAY